MPGRCCLCVLSTAAVLLAPAQAQDPASPAAARPSFVNGLGDLMNTYIQPRHAKLGLAIRNENWPLANYALHELRQSLRKVGEALPQFRRLSVPDMIEANTADPMRTMEKAIKGRDLRQATAAFAKLTAGCNSCHMATKHAFVVITVPTEAAFPNQEFRPAH